VKAKEPKMIARIWTIGHSTRKIDIFLSLLKESGIKFVADVRMYPGSKRYPQFGREALAKSLSEYGIRYEHFPELGGRRKAKPDSKNTAWRNESFRGYAELHGDGRFLRRHRATYRSCGSIRSDRDHVRGSGLVAVPSLIDFGLSQSPRG
jgi:Protein of unknown function, DUF488